MKRLIFSLFAAMALCACEREIVGEMSDAFVEIRFEKDFVAGGTKSSVLPDAVESVESGAVVAFYNAKTGRLDSQHRVENFSDPLHLKLPAGKMNIYVLGNMWLIDASGAPREPVFPPKESDVAGMAYRFGGVDAGGGLRTETYAEIGDFGIPVRGELKDVDISPEMSIGVGLERLFAKVRITIDHSGMSVTDGQFRNEKLYFRQANAVQTPFAPDGSRARLASDLMDRSDYESPMVDGQKMSYCFYLPENRVVAPDAGLATYVEFSAEIDKAAGGYGGGVTYRFHLGKKAGEDNDLQRNTWYDVLLTFNVGSLFDPCWRVNPDSDFSDDRLFCVMKDAACTSQLGSQDVAVRAGRPGRVYVYMNRTGVAGANHLAGRRMTDSFVASGLEDCAFGGDFSQLAEYGISANWNASEGRLDMSVTDGSKFVTGVRIPVTLRLYPGSKSLVMNVLTAEDQSIGLDASEFYMGMKRTATLRGFVGTARTVRVGSATHSKLLSFSNDASKPYIGADGASISGNSVGLYAWGPSGDQDVTLYFESDDDFNDSAVKVAFRLWKPAFRSWTKTLDLLLDGTGAPVDFGYNGRNGARLDESAFDSGLYSQLLAPKVAYSKTDGEKYTGYESSEFFIDYLGNLGGSDWIGDKINTPSVPNANIAFLGEATMRPRSSLYSEYSTAKFNVRYPRYKRDFPETVRTNYLNEYFDSEIGIDAEFYTYGNNVSFSAESSSGYIKLNLRETAVDENLTRIEQYMGEEVDLMRIPGGLNLFYGRLKNPRVKSGTGEITWRTPVCIYHKMTVAPFGVFREGSPILSVYLTYPKAAWMLKKYHSGQIQAGPAWDTAGEMDAYDKYLYYSRMQTTGVSSQTKVSSPGNKVPIMYTDIFPAEYPVAKPFTAETAATAATKTWLTEVTFKAGSGYTFPQPLTSAELNGNAFYSIISGTTPIGWVLSSR